MTARIWRPVLMLSVLLAAGLSATLTLADVQINGSVRWRGYVDARDFDSSSDPRLYADLRTRVSFKADPQRNLMLFVMLQDSRIIGENSGRLIRDTNLGLHQAYLSYGLGKKWFVRPGRFIMNYGNQRLVGAVGWHYVGRTWDGLLVNRNTDWIRFDLFVVKHNETAWMLDEIGRPRWNADNDHYFYGLNFRWKESDVELFLYGDDDRTPRLISGDEDPEDVYENSRHVWRTTAGAFSNRQFGSAFDYTFNGAYQYGKYKVEEPDMPVSQKDISAYLFYLELGYTLSGKSEPRLALLADYASGDSNQEDDKLEWFDNLYYTAHKFRGFMDFLVGNNPYGLFDLALRYSMKLSKAWIAKLDLHHFQSAAEYTGSDDSAQRNIGQEIDLSIIFGDGAFNFELVGAAFFRNNEAGNYSPRLDGSEDTAYWAYAQFSARF